MYPAELTFEFATMQTVPLKLVYAFHKLLQTLHVCLFVCMMLDDSGKNCCLATHRETQFRLRRGRSVHTDIPLCSLQ